MNFKRVLTMLLALCLIANMAAPGVSALVAGESEYVAGFDPTASESLAKGEEIHVTTLRDAVKAEVAGTKSEGEWTAQQTEVPDLDLTNAELPQGIQELAEAAELYAADEVVPAFIVLEDAPLADTGVSIQAVKPAQEKALLAQQNKLISSISRQVLGGKKLDVRYQFTYLTNAVSVNVEFGKLSQIAKLDGVKTVILMPVYEACTVNTPNTNTAGQMIGVPSVWADLGYTGKGMRIAIVDTGLDLDHPSFAAAPELTENSLTLEEIEAVLPRLNVAALYPSATAEDLYQSEKVPFAFNYIDESLNATHDRDQQGDHGTHVAGIAAANALDTTSVVGVAPDAQLIVMKVFGANGGAYQDDLIASIEDALLLDVDVINMSLGATSGFSSEDPELDAIYSRVNYHDTILAISAGNETQSSYGNMWGTDQNPTSHPDSAVVGSPSTYGGAISVASAQNSHIHSTYFTVGENDYGYNDAIGLNVAFRSLAGQELEYVMIPGLGEASDFEGLDVAGKIAVISRGTINFSLKLYNAEQAGAVGAIIYNNEPGSIGLQMTDENGNLNDGITGDVPCVSVDQTTGLAMAEAEVKKLVVAAEDGPVLSSDGGQMSLFSSWGVTPSLELKPEITAIGGNMYSCYDRGEYGLMSGTSMSSPQLAGVSALVLQYLGENYPELSDVEERNVAQALMMSTAEPVIAFESGVEASPRQQGAGLVDATAALTAEAYLSVRGEDKPKAELGDDPAKTGTYKFVFDIHNISDEAQSYDLSFSLLTEDVNEDYVAYGMPVFMAGFDRALSGKVTFSEDSVEVAANSIARVEATVELSAEDMAWMDEYYANGIYVEGFVYAENTSGTGVDLSLPFLGFYGDWTAAPTLDEGYWYQNSAWDVYTTMPTVNQYYNILHTNLGATGWVLGFNPYVGASLDENGNVIYDPANNVLSPNGDGVLDNISDIYVSLMRNAKSLSFTYTDAETGEVLFEATDPYCRKTSYNAAYGQIVPYVYTWYNEPWDLTDSNGKYLPNNTKLNLTISTTGDYDAHVEDLTGDSFVAPITIDTQAPALAALEAVSTAAGNYLVLTVEENVNLADTFIMNTSGTRILDEIPESVKNADGTFTVKLDVTGLGSEFVVVLCDYATNEAAYTVTFSGDDNLPQMDESAVYAYRVMDVSYTDDTLYGWVTIDPETAEVTALTSDYMETYALTAAEYAGGYIFAVDAGYNLVAMVPGLWNRIDICNLGMKVADMSFDTTTNTMYMVGDTDYGNYLMKLDLVTGEYEEVCYMDGTVYSIEFTDTGDLYVIKGSSAHLWKMNWETMELESVMEFTGNEYPWYSQSMTFDAENNCLYWAYCTYMASGFGIYTIDLDTLTYTKADFANNSEYVGLLMLDDGVVEPECDGVDCPASKFDDVNLDAYYHEGIDFAVGNGYMNGTSATTFAPTKAATRAMVLTVLYRMAGEPEVTASHSFTDVAEGSYYADAVAWGVENGIVNGKTPNTFAPKDPVSRQELITFVYRFAKHIGCDVTTRYDSLAAFEDASEVSGYAVAAMKWAVGNGLINGVTATSLAPKGLSNRAQLATLLVRLHQNGIAGFHLPVSDLEGLKIAPERVLMSVGSTTELKVYPQPWNAKMGDVGFASTDESVAVVTEEGIVVGISGGECEIVAVCGDLSTVIPVRIVDVQGTIHAYNYYASTLGSGYWMTMDLSDLSGVTMDYMTPVDFVAADYNGHDGLIYGFDGNYTLYSWNQETDEVVTIGSAGNSVQITDMAYDYTTGIMYAVGVNTSTYNGALYQVDVRTGKLVLVGESGDYLAFFGLAIDMEGNMYALDSNSCLYKLQTMDVEDWMTGEVVTYVVGEFILDTGFGGLNYTQSMCYDHNNDQIVWAACGGYSTIFWMDPAAGDYLELGPIAEDMFFEFMGLHSIPAQIPELPVFPLENAELPESLVVMAGGSKAAPLNLQPLNATIDSITWSSADESVATVDANGTITGVTLGETSVTVTIVAGETTITDTMAVTVMESADNLYAFVLTDFATMGGNAWAKIFDNSPETPEYLMGTDWTIEAAEYYDGYVYAYGYDAYSWEDTSRYLFKFDPETFEIVEAVNTGMELFVYDMSYDYSTGTMYAVASYNNDGGADLYMVDLKSGKLILVSTLDMFFQTIAFDKNGTLYGMADSVMMEDPITWEITMSNACLYTIDTATGEYTLVGDTGKMSNMYASMAFDFDTGNLYWNTCYRMDFWSPVEARFCVVDPATGAATDLGLLGASGSQTSSLIVIADEYPEIPETVLSRVTFDEKLQILAVGQSVALSPLVIHPSAVVELSYASSDESVATVDAEGNVTGIAPGGAEITVTATQGDIVVTDTCRVAVFAEDATMMAFENKTSTWSTIGRFDITQVASVSEAQEDILLATYVGDKIYGFDAEHNFFVIEDETTYARTILGTTGLELGPVGEIGADYLEMRGITYDAANDRLLVLAAKCCLQESWVDEYLDSTVIYEVNLDNGNLTPVVTLSGELSNVRGMAADDAGNVYVYAAFDDYFSQVNMDDGSFTHKCTLQSLGIYGSAEHNMPMAYDAATGLVYCLFTSNGSFYRMLSFNPVTAQVEQLGNVGEVIYDNANWRYDGPTFSALLIKN